MASIAKRLTSVIVTIVVLFILFYFFGMSRLSSYLKKSEIQFKPGMYAMAAQTDSLLENADFMKGIDSLIQESKAPIEITRYPTMEAPDQVDMETEFAVQVSLTEVKVTTGTRIASGDTTMTGKLRLLLPDYAEKDHWMLDVVLSAPGFNFHDGRNIASIELPRLGDSTPAIFLLSAKPIGTPQQDFKLYATLWYDGSFLAKIFRDIVVLNPDSSDVMPPPVATDTTTSAPKRGQELILNALFQSPDLTLFILENLNPMNPDEVDIIINSPYLHPYRGTYTKPAQLEAWLESQYQKLVDKSMRNVRPSDIDTSQAMSDKEQTLFFLKGLGQQLYRNFAPSQFKQAFWLLTDHLSSDFQTIQIYTNNPNLPWELMIPSRDNLTEERNFIGVDFKIARWHVSETDAQLVRPPQLMKMRELVVIAPQYGGTLDLPNQQVEMNALQLIPGYRRLNGDFSQLRTLFGDFPEGIIHFAGHGEVRSTVNGIAEYVIRLRDYELDVMTWRGLTAIRSRNHPFFFFNACEIGQSQKVANFVDGWAPAVLEAGASGYVGGLWPLGDKGAAEFAIRFYQLLEDRKNQGSVNIADLLRETRRQFFENGDPTFLAYIYYGDPNFRLTRETM